MKDIGKKTDSSTDSSIGISSQWLSLRYYLFFFAILVFSIIFIVTGFQWKTVVVVTIPIYVINFILGYYTIKAIFLKRKTWYYEVAILGFLSYVMVPFLVSYVYVWVDGLLLLGDNPYWVMVEEGGSLSFFSSTFGINFFVNTLMLSLYYNTIVVVDFEGNPEDHLKQEEGGDGKNDVHPSENHKTKGHLFLRSNRVLTRIRLDEIVYLEVSGNTVHIQTSKSFYETRSSLGEIIQGLPEDFIQINKSVVINLAFFEQLVFENDTKRSKAKVVFRQEEEDIEESFYIGRKFLPAFKSKLSL